MIIPLQSMRWYESAIRFVPLFIGRTSHRMRTFRGKGRSRPAGAIERTCTIGIIGIDYRAAAARLAPVVGCLRFGPAKACDCSPETRECYRVYVAISTRCFSDLPFPQACAQVLDLEFDKLELWLDDAGHLSATEASVDPEGFVESYRDTTRVVAVAINVGHGVSADVFRGL